MIAKLAHEHWPALASEMLVLWLIIGPPALGYGTIHAALANHIALAMALGALIATATALRAASVTVALLGGWLAASPWLTGYAAATTTGTINDLVTGMALITLALIQRRRTSRGTHPRF